MRSRSRTRVLFGLLALAGGGLTLLLFAVSYVNGFLDAGAGDWWRANFLAPGFGAFAFAVMLFGWMLLRTRAEEADAEDAPRTAAGPQGAASGPVEVPPESVELEEGGVYACLRCGSRRLRFMPLGAGFFPEVECVRCHHRGMPMQFDNTAGYRQFVKGLQEEARENRVRS